MSLPGLVLSFSLAAAELRSSVPAAWSLPFTPFLSVSASAAISISDSSPGSGVDMASVSVEARPCSSSSSSGLCHKLLLFSSKILIPRIIPGCQTPDCRRRTLYPCPVQQFTTFRPLSFVCLMHASVTAAPPSVFLSSDLWRPGQGRWPRRLELSREMVGGRMNCVQWQCTLYSELKSVQIGYY